jgi:general secretion pathway protein M
MTSLPDGLRGRTLAVLLLVVLLGTLYRVTVQPLVALYGDNEQSLAEQQQLIEHLRLTTAELPALRRATEPQDDGKASGRLLIDAASDAVGVAQLQSMLKEIVATRGATVTSAEGLNVERDENFRRIGVRLSLNAGLATLAAVLQGIDEARPTLIVDDLEVHTAASAASVAPGEERRLTITMDVYAFRAE